MSIPDYLPFRTRTVPDNPGNKVEKKRPHIKALSGAPFCVQQLKVKTDFCQYFS
jgi:hypothetical protein